MKLPTLLPRLAAAALLGLASLAAMADAGELRAKHAELRDQLRDNPYHRAIHIDSVEAGDILKGDVYAVLDHPFQTVSSALKDPSDWCDILLLPFNTKYCRPEAGPAGTNLQLRIGRKVDQPVEEAYRIDFALRPVVSGADYFESRLNAGKGPLGTRDYRIVLAAVPLDSGHTFMHLSYAYANGGLGRMAMNGYLSTAGADKVGFTVVGRDANGQPQFINGVRGAIERNVMRYYLAIDAHLASLSAPAGQQVDKRIETWFNATERYARQLHEMDRSAYVAMKRGEYERQQTVIQ
jgi:hypothetical protein